MSFGSFDNDDEVMSEINMTPLVDVMLVLLIIFLARLAPAVARVTASTAPVRVVIGRRVSSVLAKLPRRGGV